MNETKPVATETAQIGPKPLEVLLEQARERKSRNSLDRRECPLPETSEPCTLFIAQSREVRS